MSSVIEEPSDLPDDMSSVIEEPSDLPDDEQRDTGTIRST